MTLLELFKELYGRGAISQAMRLDVLSPSLAWAPHLVAGMQLLADYVAIEAEDTPRKQRAARLYRRDTDEQSVRALKTKYATVQKDPP